MRPYLLELGVYSVPDALGDVVDVWAGGAGESEALGSLLDAKNVGAARAEHQHSDHHKVDVRWTMGLGLGKNLLFM